MKLFNYPHFGTTNDTFTTSSIFIFCCNRKNICLSKWKIWKKNPTLSENCNWKLMYLRRKYQDDDLEGIIKGLKSDQTKIKSQEKLYKYREEVFERLKIYIKELYRDQPVPFTKNLGLNLPLVNHLPQLYNATKSFTYLHTKLFASRWKLLIKRPIVIQIAF